MGSKKHKKHKDKKHSSSNPHDESNHSFNSSMISGEQGPLKLVLRVPGGSSNSPEPHMSPSVHNVNQEHNQDNFVISFSGLEGNMIDGRPYSSSSSKKMKKKKSKKKHKKHSHHHSHHHHSHHKHRSSCSHHSSKHSIQSTTDLVSSTNLPVISNQLQSPQDMLMQTQLPPPQHYMMTNNNINEFSQLEQQAPQQMSIEAPATHHHLPSLPQQPLSQQPLSQQPSPQQQISQLNQPFSPPMLTGIPNLPPVTMSTQQSLDQLMNTTPITSPATSSAMNNESTQLNRNNLYNTNSYTGGNNFSTCSLGNNNNLMNSVMPPLSTMNYVSNVPASTQQQPKINEMDLMDLNQSQISTPLPTSIRSPVQTTSIPHHQPQKQQHSPHQLIRAPIGIRPLVDTQFQSLLGYLLKQLQKRDPQEWFLYPVTDLIAPGYSSIITKPMDFSKIDHKIKMNSYENLIQFRSDVKLMCDNAMTYNRPDTVYCKAARKLWHYAREKIFNRDSVLELVKLYQGVTNYQLGLTCADYTDSEQINTIPYTDFSEAQMNEQIMTPEQMQMISEISPKVNVSEEQMTSDQILEEVRKTANEAADRLSLAKPRGSQYTLLRQLDDGTTSLAIVGSSVNGYQEEKYINLESLIGKLNEGAPHLPGFKESDLNTVKPIEPIVTSPFASYLPNSDSSKANLTEKEIALLMSTYGDEVGLSYSQSLLKFASDSDYVLSMVDSLLDVLTNGHHTKLVDELKENQKEDSVKEETQDIEMTDDKEKESESLEEKLNETSELVSNLEKIQNSRLSSSTLPVKPSKEECKIANILSNKLTELIGTYTTPNDVSDLKSIRKALGVQIKSEILNT